MGISEWDWLPAELIDFALKLAGASDDSALRAFLLSEFGEGGVAWDANMRAAAAAMGCKRHFCGECTLCMPYDAHLMLERVDEYIREFKSGSLVLSPDEWKLPESDLDDLPF